MGELEAQRHELRAKLSDAEVEAEARAATLRAELGRLHEQQVRTRNHSEGRPWGGGDREREGPREGDLPPPEGLCPRSLS